MFYSVCHSTVSNDLDYSGYSNRLPITKRFFSLLPQLRSEVQFFTFLSPDCNCEIWMFEVSIINQTLSYSIFKTCFQFTISVVVVVVQFMYLLWFSDFMSSDFSHFHFHYYVSRERIVRLNFSVL